MGISYPDRTNATGIWKLKDITRNINQEGTYPQHSSEQTGIYSGGSTPTSQNTIESIQINTTGNGVDFGDLDAAIRPTANAGGFTRNIICGGADPDVNTIQYVNFASQGNTADFGNDQNTHQWKGGGGSNGVRSIWAAGTTPGTTNISSILVATLGDAVDYGDLTEAVYGKAFGTNGNSTIAAFSGGNNGSNTNRIEIKDITSSGNNTDFGDLTQSYRYQYATNSATKNFIAGGEGSSVIDQFTLGSKGNAADFGDIGDTKSKGSGVSNGRTAVYGGGSSYPSEANINVIETFNMSSAGNASDFGDLTQSKQLLSSNSNGHGGLQAESQRAPELYSPTGKILPSGGGVGDIGIFAGGNGTSNIIQFITIASTGNAVDFGDKTVGVFSPGGLGSTVRAVFAGGEDPSANVDTIDFVEFRSKGNASDFGNLSAARRALAGLSSDTRGVFGGGREGSVVNTIEYITIASIGNATDFGDLNTSAATTERGSAASTTRGIFAGFNRVPSVVNDIDYITIASTGNASDFGDTTDARYAIAGASSSVRAVFGGGRTSGGSVRNIIDYITIASTGNATDFGDLSDSRYAASAVSNSLRAVFAGGETPYKDVMDFVTIASTGNATDYGDLTASLAGKGPASNGHGGLS